MTKLLFLLVLLGVVAAYLSIRYKRQIVLAIKVFKALRGATRPAQSIPTEPTRSERLLQCARCGTWVAESVAVKLRAQGVYCSPSCIEKSATAV